MLSDLRRHKRFLVAVLIGFLGGLLTWFWSDTTRILFGADLFFVAYLASTLYTLRCLTPEKLAHHADDDDEGMPVILFLSLTGIGLSMFSVVQIMRDSGPATALSTGLALASIPLGWAVLHGVMAFHYADMWYSGRSNGQPGLDFGPDQPDPDMWDFFYYSFTIGMAAQTADISLRSRAFRKMTLMHSVLSYFFNTVIIALAVGAAANLVQ
jgi:uncharacterized membrane protein